MNTARTFARLAFGLAWLTAAVNASGQAPAFTVQPVSHTVQLGDSVTFAAEASGSPEPAFQWKKNGTVIPGATDAWYFIASTVLSDVGTYTVVVSNVTGTVTSNPAALALVTSQWNTFTGVTAGQTAAFSITATGASTFVWTKGPQVLNNGDQTPSGSTVSVTNPYNAATDATTSNLNITNTHTGDAGNYSVTVNGDPDATYYSSLTVRVAPGFSVQPQSKTVVAPAGVSFQVTAQGSPNLTLQWWHSDDGINWDTLSGETGSTLTFASTDQESMNGRYYRCVAKVPFASPSETATSQSALLTVLIPQTTALQLHASATQTYGTDQTLSTSGGDGTGLVTYAVVNQSGGGLASVSGSVLHANSGRGTVTIQATKAGDSTYASATSDTFSITLHAAPNLPTGHTDFDGDGRTELVWRNTNTTQISSWTAAGGFFAFGTESGGWSVAGFGDFDGDGKAEVLWHNTSSGFVASWPSAGGFQVYGVEGGGWAVINTGDFDGDGKADVLWHNTSNGLVASWTTGAGFQVYGVEGGGWAVINTGDFDGDGKSDVLWHNTSSGFVASWPSAGGFQVYGVESDGWAVINTGDFDGDGKAEPLWHNTISTQVGAWTMAGTYRNFGPESGGWAVIDVGDYDGDGRTEPLWRNSISNQISAWTAAGGFLNFGPESGGWQVIRF